MGDNSSAFAALDAQAEKLRRLANVNEECATEVAGEFGNKIASNASAQIDPYDHPWRPSKDGLPVLVNAASHVKCSARGSTVEVSLNSAVDVRHHVGSANGYRGGSAKLGGFRRAIIPFNKLPGPFKAIVRKVFLRRCAKTMGVER